MFGYYDTKMTNTETGEVTVYNTTDFLQAVVAVVDPEKIDKFAVTLKNVAEISLAGNQFENWSGRSKELRGKELVRSADGLKVYSPS